jgi:signal transduction histidine kinase/DNA-binding response OmpR family regulator
MKTFFTRPEKRRDSDEFARENRGTLITLNKYIAVIGIVSELYAITYFDINYSSKIYSPELDIASRILLILMCILLFLISHLQSLNKFADVFSQIFVFAAMIIFTNFELNAKDAVAFSTVWAILIVVFIGIYPISLRPSLIIFFISLAYYIIIVSIRGEFLDFNTQFVMSNIISTVLISVACKYFIIKTRQKEFYSRKALERSNREIADLNDKLKSYDQLKTDFFSNISHEIRTPLTLILAPIELYLDGKMKINNIDEFLSGIRRNSLRLKTLVNDLLDFSKLDAGKMNLTVKKTDIGKFLLVYVESFRTVAELKSISLAYNLPESVPEIFIDRAMIDRVLMNLFSNALKFTEAKGEIEVTLESDDSNCMIKIRDTGPGIPESMKDAIFERFMQLDSGLSRGHEGTGIGLSLAKEYMTLHGGTIAVETRHYAAHPEDHGSVFTLTFPLGTSHFSRNIPGVTFAENDGDAACPNVHAAEYLSTDKHAGVKASAGKPLVLVVEDNGEMAGFLTHILQEECEVQVASNGRAAIEMLDSADFDLVIADIMMPVLDGITMLGEIRSAERFARLPVIMLTANVDERLKLDSLESGANDYLTKPFNARELLARARTHIHLKVLTDELAARIDSRSAGRKNLTGSTKSKLDAAVEFLDNNYLDFISRENLSASLGMSPDHFSRMFKQLTGVRVQEYLTELRIRHAARLIASTDKKIIDIAMESGFESVRSFNREFTRRMKSRPSDYRENIRHHAATSPATRFRN